MAESTPQRLARRPGLRAGGALLRRVRELCPVTRLGFFVAGLSALGLRYYGLSQLDLVWYVAALSGLAMVGLCALLVLLAVPFARRSARRGGAGVSREAASRVTQLAFDTGYRVTRLRFWPLLESELSWREPREARVQVQVEAGQHAEHAVLSDHGEVRQVARSLTVRDVLGLAAVTLRRQDPVHWEVLPHRGALGEVPWLSSLAGGDDIPHPMGVASGDRLELRRYSPGDPARFIHWKAYARTRKLVVRVPERALSRSHRTAAYLVAGPEDAASAASALAAMEAGALGADWVFGADGAEALCETPREVEAAVRRSAAARAAGGAGLQGFLSRVAAQGPVALMLFAPPVAGDWERHVVAAIRNSTHRPCVVLGVDHLQEPSSAPLWQRLAWLQGAQPGLSAPALRALAGRLRAAGADVWIADRPTGRLLGVAHLAAVGGGRAAA